jgi:hypothetical protein
LKKDPTERLGANVSVDMVRQHPFFEGMDWIDLQEKQVKPPEELAKVACVGVRLLAKINSCAVHCLFLHG